MSPVSTHQAEDLAFTFTRDICHDFYHSYIQTRWTHFLLVVVTCAAIQVQNRMFDEVDKTQSSEPSFVDLAQSTWSPHHSNDPP